MTEAVHNLLTLCLEGKEPEDYVFTRPNGRRVKDLRRLWKNAREAAGVPNLLFHDLRHTAARNFRRAGVAEGVIMKIGRWKTRSVFERYAIVAHSDIEDALERLERKELVKQRPPKVQKRYGSGKARLSVV